jgi:hypothetical protein
MRAVRRWGLALLGIIAAVLLHRLEGGAPLELIVGSPYRQFGRMALLANARWLLLEGGAFALAFQTAHRLPLAMEIVRRRSVTDLFLHRLLALGRDCVLLCVVIFAVCLPDALGQIDLFLVYALHAGCVFAGSLALCTEMENRSAVWLVFWAEVLLAMILGWIWEGSLPARVLSFGMLARCQALAGSQDLAQSDGYAPALALAVQALWMAALLALAGAHACKALERRE